MRRYDLYISKVHWIDSIYDENDTLIEHIYRYDKFVHIGYSIGVRPLVNYLGNPKYVNCADSFYSDDKATLSTKCSCNIKDMYLIIDDKGRIRNYSELAKGANKKRNSISVEDINELRQYPHAKIKAGRLKRQSLPSYFDDVSREYQRNWKESFKCKKQYMKNQK